MTNTVVSSTLETPIASPFEGRVMLFSSTLYPRNHVTTCSAFV